ncbi:MAG TPA: bifunctional diaminohydroxyphosphoribosylaminopyrimidine deaminase/5-amino-6-(5-phosphoribosylamino)uracil reductase RibD [Rhizomicrobium sp.]|nr:bifunctional diaminohydroxyphosphoribosylaminopyrimidine deaminase/5-amino-6-(5-phosphoribosylamino)uracil reductase RibD [Rhizomicrobium sp.]
MTGSELLEPLTDSHHMRHALGLAARGLGRVAPNPAVGCVIVSRHGRIVGRGWTGRGGRPHAETIALAQAGAAARGATAYVTLEPCAHQGETPPCADSLIQAGIARVVAATTDPDRRVSGRGFDRLREAGIDVRTPLLESEATALNLGFFLCIRANRPFVTLKIAASVDGRTASAGGESRWITGEQARRFGHLLRATHDAVLVGIETALSDDPLLTCRIPGLERDSPVRVVLDTRLRLSERSKLARSAREVPTLLFTVAQGGDALAECGVEIMRVGRDVRGRPDIGAVLRELASRGITRLLVEGGAGVHATFLDRGYADRLEVFRAPLALGESGHAAIDALAAFSLDEAPRFASVGTRRLGTDLLESFDVRH